MHKTLFMAWVLTLVAAGTAHADTGVFPVRGTNLSDGEMRAIGNVISSAYAFRTGKPVVGPDQVGPVLVQTASERDAAQQLGLLEYLTIDAVRLTTRISLLVTLHNKHGSDLYRLRTTATSLDDLEVVSERIALAIERRTEMEYTRTIDNVTGKETQRGNRMFVEKIFGARVAAVLPVAAHLSSQGALALGFDGRLEKSDYFLEFGLGFIVPSELRGAGIGGLLTQFGASYYLTHSSIAPYVGLGVSPRIMMGDYEGVGFSGNAQFGVMFMRESSTRLYIELRLDQNLIALHKSSDTAFTSSDEEPVTRTPNSVLPTELSLAAGIGW